MTIRDAIISVIDGHDLSLEDARDAMREIMDGEATQVQIAGCPIASSTSPWRATKPAA